MTWFMAVLVRGSFVEDSPDEDRMGDLLFRLVEAPDSERAYGRALEIGAACGESLTDPDGHAVTMRFLGLADLTQISSSDLGEGVEVYSELVEKRPSERVVAREQLTVFGPDEPPPFSDDEQPIFSSPRENDGT